MEMVCNRCCIASIGVPAAMRPITGIITGGLSLLTEGATFGRTRPKLPAITLGENFCGRTAPTVADSGRRRTSIARLQPVVAHG